MPDAAILPLSLAQPELRVGDAVRCNRTGADGVVVDSRHSKVNGQVIRVLVRFPALSSWRTTDQVTRTAGRVRVLPDRPPATVIHGFAVDPRPRAARDVPPGAPWTFADHRPPSQVPEQPEQPAAARAVPAGAHPALADLPPPRFWGLYILAVTVVAGFWLLAVLAGLP